MDIDLIITTCDRHYEVQRMFNSISSIDIKFKRIILVDNGIEKIDTTLLQCKSEIIYLPVRPRIGSQMARNIGFAFSKATWLMFFDDDDEFITSNVHHVLNIITDDIKIIFSESIVISRNQLLEYRTLPLDFRKINLIDRNPFTFSGTIIKADLFIKVGAMQNSLRSLQDWDLWLRVFNEISVINVFFNRISISKINIDNETRISNSKFKISFALLILRNFKFLVSSGGLVRFFHKIVWRLIFK